MTQGSSMERGSCCTHGSAGHAGVSLPPGRVLGRRFSLSLQSEPSYVLCLALRLFCYAARVWVPQPRSWEKTAWWRLVEEGPTRPACRIFLGELGTNRLSSGLSSLFQRAVNFLFSRLDSISSG